MHAQLAAAKGGVLYLTRVVGNLFNIPFLLCPGGFDSSLVILLTENGVLPCGVMLSKFNIPVVHGHRMIFLVWIFVAWYVTYVYTVGVNDALCGVWSPYKRTFMHVGMSNYVF